MLMTPIAGIASGIIIGLGINSVYSNVKSIYGWGLIGAGILIIWIVTKPWGKRKR